MIAVMIYLTGKLRLKVYPEGGYEIESRLENIGWILDNDADVDVRKAILDTLDTLHKLDYEPLRPNGK